MADPQPDAPTEPRAPTSETAPADAVPAADPAADPGLERRAFVRRMGTDAVRTAGSVFSISRILTRSATAAGQSVIGELERIQVGTAAAEVAGPAVPVEMDVAVAPTSSVPAAPSAQSAPSPAPADVGSAPRPPLRIDDEQRAILEAASAAIVAVNREGNAPQLTAATVLWDGETLRFLTLGWARRTTMLRADPHVGLLIEAPRDGRFVTITGQATIVDGRSVRDAAWPLLLREAGGSDEIAETRWQTLLAEDVDRAVIVVAPEQVLSGVR